MLRLLPACSGRVLDMKCARLHPGRTGALLSRGRGSMAGRVLTTEGGVSVPSLARRVLITVSRTYMGRSTATPSWESGFLGNFGYIN